jgi:hypothetical protein
MKLISLFMLCAILTSCASGDGYREVSSVGEGKPEQEHPYFQNKEPVRY